MGAGLILSGEGISPTSGAPGHFESSVRWSSQQPLTDNPLAEVGPEAFEKLDAILVTHGHRDHIADVEAIAKKSGALVVSNFEIASHFSDLGCESHPMHIGGGRQFPFGHVKFTIAHHGSTGPNGEALGNPMGVVLTMSW